MTIPLKHIKVTALPEVCEANAIYFVNDGSVLSIYVTSNEGTAFLAGGMSLELGVTETTAFRGDWGLEAYNNRINVSEKGSANGVATLDGFGKLIQSQLPEISITSTYVVSTELSQINLLAQEGDVCVRTDLNKSFIRLNTNLGTISDWQLLLTPTDNVLSVNGLTGAVVLNKSSIGLSNVDNTSDLNKPISTATQQAISLRAFLPTYYIDENIDLNDLKDQGEYTFQEGVNLTVGGIVASFDPASCKLISESFNDNTGDNWRHVRQTLWDGNFSYVRYYEEEGESWSIFNNITPAIVDNLTSISINNPLSAKQGKILKDLVDATQTALNQKLSASLKGAINGVAELGADGKVPSAQLPELGTGGLSVNQVLRINEIIN